MTAQNPAQMLQLGTWLSVGSPVIAELAALCGLDWVLLDLEHGCAPEAAIPDQLRALRSGAIAHSRTTAENVTQRNVTPGNVTQGIVRVGIAQPDLIARLLDWGADGIMVPHVNSRSEAEAIVQAAYYPPQGQRGVSRTVRAHDFGLRPLESTPAPRLIAQIETLTAVNAAAEIARVDGIDVLFVGPADLQHDLKLRPATDESNLLSFEDCLTHVVQAARAAGKAAGLLIRDPSDLPRRLQQGFNFIAIQSDLALLRDAFQSLRAGSVSDGHAPN